VATIDYNDLFINKLNKKYVSMKRLTYLLLCLFASIAFATAQTTKVTGTVISAEDDGPIIGASIVVAGTTTGTVTDYNGAFTLDVPSNAKKLIVSYIGMKSVEVAVKPIIKVTMESDSQNLDEVVVVGYGTQRKKDVTSAISKVGGEDLSNLATASFDSQLAGRAAGVQVTTPSGVLGSGPQFKIRGMSTISSNSQPLFIVDGMPIATGDNADGKTGLGMAYASYNAMSDINPNDIESIEILKDGAATAIYGSRAANGVVLITTKKGSKGRTQVTYDGYVSAASAAKLHDLLGAKDFVTIANEKYENWGMKGQAVYDPNGPDTNWNDYIFRTGFQHNHSLSASGGTDKSQYYVSLGFTEQEGIIRANDLNRLSLKADLTQQATKWLRIGLNGQMTRTRVNGVMNDENSLGGVGFAGTRMLPNVSVFNPDDPTGYNIDAENRKTLGRGSNLSYIDNGIQNIVWALDNNVNRTTNTRTLGGGWAEITFMDGLTLKTQAGLDISNVKDFMVWNPESGDGYGYGGLLEEINTTYTNWNWQNVINFNRTFNDVHNLTATAVQEYTHQEYEYTDATVQQISDAFFTDHIISNTFGERFVSGGKTFMGLASYMFRANYNYDSKYYIGASVRTDGLSSLPTDTRWGTFWSVGGAWLINKESWFDASWVQELKLKASIGSQGNDNIGDFLYTDRFNIINSNNSLGTSFKSKGTKDITWETNTNFNIGAEFQLWNRVTGSIEYYRRKTSDMLFSFTVAPSLGYASYMDNVGNMVNSGVEMDFNVNIFDTRNFTWDVNVNISTLKNRITMLDPDKLITTEYTADGKGYKGYSNGSFFIGEDLSMFTWRLKEYAGVNEKGESLFYKNVKDEAGNITGRETTTNHAQADYYITEESSIPKVYGGFGTKLKVYGVDFGINFTYQIGGKQYDGTYAYFMSSPYGTAGYNYHKDLLNSWTPENTNTNIPRFQMNDQYSGAMSTRFLTNASFLNIQNINVGYTLPSKWTRKLAINSLRVYMSAENVFYWSKRKGFDPRQSYDETTNATFYSPMRTISGGVSFEF
jgi:TonB-linked SusC/RagA family outer membrane protein